MCLIPKSHYNLHGTGINDNHFLGIWVDPSIRLKDEDGKLNLSAINIKRIPGFSTNKLPPTKKWYLNIQFKKEFSNPYLNEWNKDEDGVYPLRDHYDFITDRGHYFLKAREINGAEGGYTYPVDSQNSFTFTLFIVHKPLVSNFWHFEFDITSPHGRIEKTSAAWHKLICSVIIDTIQEKAVFSI